MKLKMTEHQLQNSILQWLPYIGVTAFRINSGMVPMVNARGAVRLIRMGTAGTPDLIGYVNKRFGHGNAAGHMVAIEVKVGKNKLSDIQARTLKDMEDNGVWTLVAYSVEDVQSFFGALSDQL